MTEELFRADAYLRECTATVVASSADGIELERTVFYPEGGGQPGDRGMLRSTDGTTFAIVDTRKGEDGRLLHLPAADAALPTPGDEVTAIIDWDYRYRHMRTHTALHLMCALVPYPVTGGSISQDKGRLDFDMAEGVDKEALEAALNALVIADHPVGYRWITDAEMAANMALVRTMSVKPPMGQGRVRLVDVDGVDLQPCGGTHVACTGEIGHVRLGKVEKKGRQNRRINLHLD
ncbi:MAG: alanyl-tRNA editing protein [Gammaproteobacteria bacterium]|nr:alanyl-tRNA editing protein [Gammaproteobacteria bacterium]MCP5200800.1 alanyl-tRNA editing protein [Gammaproteobacteria bacterium]